ncbi:phage tail protein [Paractinoplanes deccanensis]|uniref:phage tail protein n=1 Tax=Paractinoplanes deccanensis TaxID=113561 RepID=UPI0019419AAB|nr:phage tail protein [Actinoplanes deccanensis]
MADVLLTTFRFEVTFNRVAGAGAQRLGDGGFQEVTGLDVEMDVKDYEEGGRNDGIVRRVGRAKYSPLVCKRGMFGPEGGDAVPELWQWFQDIVAGVRPVRRYDGTVVVQDQRGRPAAAWLFRAALPVKLVGPQLNARTGEVAVEELHLAHEGLLLEGTA